MAGFKSFEEIEAWKMGRGLTREIYALTKQGAFMKDFGLRDQIQRACISIMSNIAEGCERGSDQEFKRYLIIAKGSAGEVRAQLYVALDQQYITMEIFNRLATSSGKISRMLNALIEYLNKSDKCRKSRTRAREN